LQDDDYYPVTAHYGRDLQPRRDFRDDDEGEHGAKRHRSRSLLGKMSNWLDSQSRGRDRQMRGRSRD
jgi:hypothetical protein